MYFPPPATVTPIAPPNTKLNNVKTITLNDSQVGDAFALELSGNNLYLCGTTVINQQSKSTCWIVDVAGRLLKTIVLSDDEDSFGTSIAKINNSIYVAGIQYTGSQSFTTLWITNLNGSFKKTISFSPGISGEGLSIPMKTFNQKIYIASNNQGQATLWITDAYGTILACSALAESDLISLPFSIVSLNPALLFQAVKSFSPVKEQKGL